MKKLFANLLMKLGLNKCNEDQQKKTLTPAIKIETKGINVFVIKK